MVRARADGVRAALIAGLQDRGIFVMPEIDIRTSPYCACADANDLAHVFNS
jgi:hypothetical protein